MLLPAHEAGITPSFDSLRADYSSIGYFFLTLMIRVLARRPGAQMTPFEFVLVFLVGGVIILATVGDDRSITNCYGGVIAICLMHRLVGTIKQRSPRLANFIDGTPIVLLQNGRWETSSMKQAHVDDMDVMAAAREKNAGRWTRSNMPFSNATAASALSRIKS